MKLSFNIFTDIAGELILNENPEEIHAGTKADIVGPGQYNVHNDEVWQKKVTDCLNDKGF
jgi:hypothetical protein